VKRAHEHPSRYRFTAHAQDAIAERGISISWVERVLSFPITVERDKQDPALRHAIGRIPERDDRILRVVYNDTVKPQRVVTAFFDRKAGRVS
jgi:hypothetical protein